MVTRKPFTGRKDWSINCQLGAQAMKDHEHIARWLEAAGIERPVCEHHFHPTREWRFDLAWIEQKVAVETQGGIWVSGAHVMPLGYVNDCEKLNEAQMLGWTVLWIIPNWWDSGKALTTIRKALHLDE